MGDILTESGHILADLWKNWCYGCLCRFLFNHFNPLTSSNIFSPGRVQEGSTATLKGFQNILYMFIFSHWWLRNYFSAIQLSVNHAKWYLVFQILWWFLFCFLSETSSIENISLSFSPSILVSTSKKKTLIFYRWPTFGYLFLECSPPMFWGEDSNPILTETHMMFQSIHPRSLTVRPWKLDAWKMILSFLVWLIFRVELLNFQGGSVGVSPPTKHQLTPPRHGDQGGGKIGSPEDGFFFFFLNGEIWATGMFFLFIRESVKNHRILVDCKVLGLKFANDRMFSHGWFFTYHLLEISVDSVQNIY